MTSYLGMVLLGSITGGIVQSTIGFGCGIIQMVFFPLVFNLLHASAISSSICIALTFSLAFRFHRHVSMKKVIPPSIFYTIASVSAIWIAPGLDMKFLVLVYSIFLIAIALFFFLGKNHFSIKPSPLAGGLIAAFSGVTGGLFGIGGPLMGPYYLADTSSKEEYIGTLQTIFVVATSISFLVRIYRGIYALSLVPYTLLGFVGVAFGRAIGLRILGKVSPELLSKLVYIVVGMSGILTILNNL